MQKYFSQMLSSTMDLLAIDSVQSKPCKSSPFGKGVGNALKYIENLSTQLGFVAHNQDGYYVTSDIGQEKGNTFGILGHLDVVPYENDWSASPLGEIVGDKIFGRGILDDKGPMLCCLWATAQLLQEGFTPQRHIRFIFGGNEESGWKCIEKYCELDTMPQDGFSPDGDFPVINCEKSLTELDIYTDVPPHLISLSGGSRGNIVMPWAKCTLDIELSTPCYDNNLQIEVNNGTTTITSTGKPAHASTPQEGDNALWHILDYLSNVLGGQYTTLANQLCNNNGSGVGCDLHDDISGNTTFNVGVVELVNDNDNDFERPYIHFLVDLRHPITTSKDDVANNIKNTINPIAVNVCHFHNPHYIDPSSPLVSTLLECYNNECGTNAQPITIGGGTYARAMEKGVAFGPMFPGQESTIHQKDEHVTMEYYLKMYKIYYQAIKKLCF